MKNLIATRTIKEILGYDFNRSGKDCWRGHISKTVNGDEVHDLQVINPDGVRSNPHFKQIVHSDGIIHSICSSPNIDHEKDDTNVLDNDFLYDNEWDVFISANVPVMVEKKKRIRVGKGKFMVKRVLVESMERGYWYGKYRIVDTWIDKETGFKHFIQEPVPLAA